MRELKFRVGGKTSGGFRYLDKGELINLYRLNPWDGSLIAKDHGRNVVVPKDAYVIEQYTGLKDKNGKEIYEGDIVMDLGGNHEVKFCEMKDTDCSYFYQGWGFDDSSLYEEHDFVEVIGNIHENAELLEHKG